MKRVLLTFGLVLAVVLSACGGCDGDDSRQTGKGVADDSAAADAGSDAGTPSIRTAFGIPLPPEGHLEYESEISIRWFTRMNVDELEEYYRGRLTDFEVIKNGTTLRLVGLRSGMASAYAAHVGPKFTPVRMTFTASVEQQKKTAGQIAKLELDGTPKKKVEPKPLPPDQFGGGRKGSPVTARLPNGELMAPGARWGEPYTPPKGSFYHKRKFKPNWGRPFGDWKAY